MTVYASGFPFVCTIAHAADAVVKKGLLAAGSLTPGDAADNAEGTPEQPWCPQPEELMARNLVLGQDPEMVGKRFVLPDGGKTKPVSTYLLKILPGLDGQFLDSVPPSYVVAFNAVLQSFCADPLHVVISTAVCRVWLVLLLEALIIEEFSMLLFPKASPSRLFSVVGHFDRVSVVKYALDL